MARIIEAGHYYQVKGPTLWSIIGWDIMKQIRTPDDKSLLMVDDIHSLEQVSQKELILPKEFFSPLPDIFIYESEVCQDSYSVLDSLSTLSKKKKAKKNGNGKWFCSGIPLTDESGSPLCVLYDAGLTLFKSHKADEAINILPYFYEEEQKNLIRIMQKILPEFSVKVILFDLKGKFWEM